ncbi:MAG: NADH-quinone oxidoreductase subunit C [Deltaproteobacteria bacterium]|nr:NADH-quinone oxidoreductase subunit C [Candidatus Anaeroferrophillus wilburensis]MBN2889979.1 NADH-quinone oxidoreductase subunit C [Deltaproteobacteria bacterium]
MHQTEQFANALRDLPATAQEVDFQQRGYHCEVSLEQAGLRGFARVMLDLKYYLVFVSAVHVEPAIEIIYQFAHFAAPSRVVARLTVDADGSVPTIADIFQGANWHERETRDFYGVVFRDHPYLKPLILAEEDADLKPLLKAEGKVKDRSAVSWQTAPEPGEAAESETSNPDPEKS